MNDRPKAVIVVPTIREESILKFLAEWKEEFKDHTILVIEDNPKKTFNLGSKIHHFSWEDIERDLGEDAWIIPRRSDAVRNYGFILAARLKPDLIISMDDDCYPVDKSGPSMNFVNEHWAALNLTGISKPYFDTMQTLYFSRGIRPRGFPKEKISAETMVNHGLWNNIPDFDGLTQLKWPDLRSDFKDQTEQVLPGTLFPMCGMNVAFRPEVIPLMYFWPMGQNQPYHRFADIWCGLIMKKVCDHLGFSVRTGNPMIHHSRASDATKNATLEAPGLPINEELWKAVDKLDLTGIQGIKDCFVAVIGEIGLHMIARGVGEPSYWDNLTRASQRWITKLP